MSVMRMEQWLHEDAFRLRWWLLLAMFTFSVIVWLRTVDKSRLREIVIYVSLIILLTLVLDELGEELTLWDYPYDLIPLFPPLSAVDIACLPMIYSVIYQRFRTWKSFIIASVIMAGLFCFILEPLFQFIGIYQMLTWKSYYGFPIYTFMAIAMKGVVGKINKISSKS